MNKTIKLVCGLAIVAGVLGGCAGNQTMSQKDIHAIDCPYPDAPKIEAPAWICGAPVEGIEVSAVGSYPKSGAGFNFMKQQAAAAARVELAQRMVVRVKSMVKSYAETTGSIDSESVDVVNTSVSKVLAKQDLVGTRIFRTVTSPNGSIYVLLGMNKDDQIINTQTALRTSMGDAQAAWQRFQAKKSHDELSKEMAEWE